MQSKIFLMILLIKDFMKLLIIVKTEKNIINKVKYLLGKIFNFISIDEKSIKLIVRITDNILQKIVIPLLLFFLFFIIKVHFLFIYYTSITLFKLFINI